MSANTVADRSTRGQVLRRWALAGAATAIALAVGYALFGDLPSRPIASVRVAGDFRHLDRAAVEDALSEHTRAGFFRVDVSVVRSTVMERPWAREVTVRRVWPDSLHIAVIERVAVARWSDATLLEADGTVFRPAAVGRFGHLPLLEGPPDSQVRVLQRYHELGQALKPLEQGVRRVSLNPRGAWRVELENGVTLVLGKEPRSDGLKRYAPAIARVIEEAETEVDKVDLRYPNGFAVRWKRSEHGEG